MPRRWRRSRSPCPASWRCSRARCGSAHGRGSAAPAAPAAPAPAAPVCAVSIPPPAPSCGSPDRPTRRPPFDPAHRRRAGVAALGAVFLKHVVDQLHEHVGRETQIVPQAQEHVHLGRCELTAVELLGLAAHGLHRLVAEHPAGDVLGRVLRQLGCGHELRLGRDRLVRRYGAALPAAETSPSAHSRSIVWRSSRSVRPMLSAGNGFPPARSSARYVRAQRPSFSRSSLSTSSTGSDRHTGRDSVNSARSMQLPLGSLEIHDRFTL